MGFGLKNSFFIFILVTCLSGCLKDELAKGPRVDISMLIVNSFDSVQIELPKQIKRRSWGGPVSKTLLGSDNYLLRDQIERNWVLNTGLAEIIGSPVIHDNKIFVFGANGQVKCINLLDRTTVWNISIHQINTNKKRIIGGGLSFDYAGNLYVTTSLGELLSVSIESGLINWRYNTDAPIIDKPTVIKDNIIMTDTSGVSRSVSSKGKLNWVVAGLSGDYIRSKIGKPVAFGELVLLPSAGGVLNAVNSKDGVKVWSFSYSSQRFGYAQNAFGVFNGDPSVFEEKIYYGSASGQFNALDKSGKSLWQADVGLQGSPLLVSDSIFFISDRNELVRLDKNSGNIIWLRKLITKKTPEHFYTPILAGSKLWITGGDSNLRSFDLETGGLQELIYINSNSSGTPIYYSGSIIVYTRSGKLLSFK